MSPKIGNSIPPNHSQKEQFPLPLGHLRQSLTVSDAPLPHSQTRRSPPPVAKRAVLQRCDIFSIYDQSWILNHFLHRFPFKMLMQKRILKNIHLQDWFANINWKDVYFYILILLQHRQFLRFAVKGWGIPVQYSSPLGCPCLPVSLPKSRRLPLPHYGKWASGSSHQQTFTVNSNLPELIQGKTAVPLKLFQRLLGHVASAATVIPLRLLHMKLLQHWAVRWAWHCSSNRVTITQQCHCTFSPWSNLAFLRPVCP